MRGLPCTPSVIPAHAGTQSTARMARYFGSRIKSGMTMTMGMTLKMVVG